MTEVISFHSRIRFDVARWVTDWEAIGGRCFLGDELPHGDLPRVLTLAPTIPSYSARWLRLKALQNQIEERGNLDAVADFVERRKATRGW